MYTLIKLVGIFFVFSLLTGCQSYLGNSEMNQCAQQNYQCENSCEQQTTQESMTLKLCSAKCAQVYNQCKSQAESLNSVDE